MTEPILSFWSDVDRAQSYLDFCAERMLDPDDPEILAWWLGDVASHEVSQ